MTRVLLLTLLAACSFPTRSGELTCKLPTDCSDGRTCEQGYCVLATTDGGAPGDGSPMSGDASADATPADGPAVAPCNGSGLTCAGVIESMSAGSACWVSCSETVAEPTAAARCVAWGGKLNPLRTAADKSAFEMIAQGGADAKEWSGLEQSMLATDVGSDWSWNSDGVEPSPPVTWGSGEPNDSDGDESDHKEQCAFATTVGTVVLSDKPCATAIAFGCERL